MKRFQSKKKGKRGNQKSGATRRGVFSAISHDVGRNEPYKLTQAASGVGCISSNNTGPSVTSALNIIITPYSIGSRCALLAAQFAQWRVNSLIIAYVPDCTPSGVATSVNGPVTSPAYQSRPFAMVWGKDPDVLPSTHIAMMEMGGVASNVARGCRIRVGKTGWLWSSSSQSYSGANIIDNRMCSAGTFSAAFADTSTTNTATYGRFVWTYNLSFRYPQNASVIGAASPEKFLTSLFESKVSDVLDTSGAMDSPFLQVDGEEVKESQTVSVAGMKTAVNFGPDPSTTALLLKQFRASLLASRSK